MTIHLYAIYMKKCLRNNGPKNVESEGMEKDTCIYLNLSAEPQDKA